MTTVAVVMATYNGERYIREQLASIEKQSVRPRELYIADDGSTDATLRLVSEFSETASFPVRIHRNETRLGYGENFLQAARATHAELVAFSDQDDIWHPEKLAQSVATFRNDDVVLSSHQVELMTASGEVMGLNTQGIDGDTVLPPLSLSPWGLLLGFTITVRRALLDVVPLETRGPDSNEPHKLAAHDRWVHVLANACGSSAMIARPLAKYRQHGSNLFGNGRSSLWPRLAVTPSRTIQMAEAYTSIARHRANVFRRAAADQSCEARLRERLLSAAELWDRISRQAASRLALYQEPTRVKRFARLSRNLLDSVYHAPPDYRLGLPALLKDTLTVIR